MEWGVSGLVCVIETYPWCGKQELVLVWHAGTLQHAASQLKKQPFSICFGENPEAAAGRGLRQMQGRGHIHMPHVTTSNIAHHSKPSGSIRASDQKLQTQGGPFPRGKGNSGANATPPFRRCVVGPLGLPPLTSPADLQPLLLTLLAGEAATGA